MMAGKSAAYERYERQGLHPPIELISSWRKIWWVVLGAGGFAIVSFLIFVAADDHPIFGLFGAFFFGGGLVFFLIYMSPGTALVTFADAGLTIPYCRARLRWEDIRAVGTAEMTGQRFVGITMENYDSYASQVSWRASLRRRKGVDVVTVSLIAAIAILGREISHVTSPLEAAEGFDKTKGFDFLLTRFDLQGVTIEEAKQIIERESVRARIPRSAAASNAPSA